MGITRLEHEALLAELTRLCVSHHHGGEMWRPRMFRASVADEAEGLADLLRSCPEIAVFDTLEAQLRELIETRNPTAPLSAREIKARMAAMLGGVEPVAYGVWVYYPWSSRLVHILDRAEFIELRTNRNQYKITAEEQRVLGGKKVGIVGLSVGQSVALTMAIERGMGEVRLADFDTLGLSNLNRLRAGLHNVGIPKVYLTAREIAEIDPFLVVKCYPDGIAQDTIDDFLLSGGPLDLLIDECDSLDIKVWLRHHARYHRIPVLMETSDRGLIDVERFDLEPERPIFHGLVGDLHPQELGGLSTNDKVPYVLQIIGEPTISNRARASMLEVGHSIKTWPQLASAVTLGGGAAADVARRMNLGLIRHSGRYWCDIEDIVPNTPVVAEPEAAGHEMPPPLTDTAMRATATALAPAQPPGLVLAPGLRLRLLAAAVAAPSGGNSQPWRWLVAEDRLHLFHDRQRSVRMPDFRHRGGLVALGAAFENLVLAAHGEGLEVAAQVFPAGEDGDLVASFAFHSAPVAGAEPHWRDDLAGVIGARHTNRRSARERLPDEMVAELRAAVRSIAGAELQLHQDDAELAELGELIGECDRLRFLDETCNVDLISEMRWTAEEGERERDGLTLDNLELSRGDRAALQMLRSWKSLRLVRAWGGGRVFTRASLTAITHSGAVGLITVPASGPRDYLSGGRATERMWLTAELLNLAVHPMTALPYMLARVEQGGGVGLEAHTRAALRRIREPYRRLFPVAEGAAEVFLFRVSRAEATPARALRRRLDDVLVMA